MSYLLKAFDTSLRTWQLLTRSAARQSLLDSQVVCRLTDQSVGATTTPESIVWDGSGALTLVANRKYRLCFNAGVTSVGSGNGVRMRLSSSATISAMSVLAMLDPSTAATGNRLINALDTDVVQTAAVGATIRPVMLDGQIWVGSTGGVLNIQFACETATGGNSATMEGPILASLVEI